MQHYLQALGDLLVCRGFGGRVRGLPVHFLLQLHGQLLVCLRLSQQLQGLCLIRAHNAWQRIASTYQLRAH